MKKMLNYYYKMYPLKIYKSDKEIYFFYNMNKYYIKTIPNKEYVTNLVKLYNQITNKLREVNEIVLNRENEYVTSYEKKLYIIIKVNGIESISIDVNDIKKYNINIDSNIKNTISINEIDIMKEEINYLENIFSGYNNEYKNLQNDFNYFVGIAENSISYISDTVDIYKDIEKSVSHIQFDDDFSNKPLIDITNISYNYKYKDISEYFRYKFDNNLNWKEEITNYFNNNIINEVNARIMFSLIIYPKRYFNYVKYSIANKIEDSVYNAKISEYELKLKDLQDLFVKYYNIEPILWISSIH